MPTIRVKAVTGRIARTSPNGEMISSDRYTSVTDTHYVRRLIDFHGDLVMEPTLEPNETVEPDEKPVGLSTMDHRPRKTPKSVKTDKAE